MTETPDQSAEPTSEIATATPASEPVEPVLVHQKPNRLYQVAAWVAIVAGTVFIVAVVFFSGFILGRHSGGSGQYGGHHHGPAMMMERGGSMMRPGFGGPGMFGPGPGNSGGQGGPGGQGQQAPTTAPSR